MRWISSPRHSNVIARFPLRRYNVFSRGRPLGGDERELLLRFLSSIVPRLFRERHASRSPSKLQEIPYTPGDNEVQRLSEKFQTTAEAAKRLGVSRVTICRWCRQGRFPGALKFARGWYIPLTGPADFQRETTTAAAERLGVSVPYVISLIERGQLAGERGPWRSYAVARGAMPLSGVKGPSTFSAA